MQFFVNGKLHNRCGFYISEIASAHKYQRGLLLCKNIIYEERKRVWVHSFQSILVPKIGLIFLKI